MTARNKKLKLNIMKFKKDSFNNTKYYHNFTHSTHFTEEELSRALRHKIAHMSPFVAQSSMAAEP